MAARNAARRLSSLRSKRGRVAGRIESWDGEYIYRGMDYVPEIFQRHALVPAGTGLETVRCKHQQNNLRQLDHRECTGFFHSHVCLLPKETACTVMRWRTKRQSRCCRNRGGAQTQSYMWLFRSGEDEGPPIILYKYAPTRAGDNAVEFLEGYSGYLMCDGYSGYNKVPDAKRTACWAHIRRYLIDAIPKGKQFDYTQPSVQGVMYVNRLFEMEDKIRKKHAGDYEAIRKAGWC